MLRERVDCCVTASGSFGTEEGRRILSGCKSQTFQAFVSMCKRAEEG